uniref:Mitochondrial carrier protein n=1 Tax=Timema monikensis TaxID=170555 RepID=A0A7R9HIB2_9NEOP|nr:unnamed protein product [Timema monikensis]
MWPLKHGRSGASAGIAVDLSLFPLDTLKTRLQSPSGFLLSGGFRNLYKGLGPAMVGSAPTAGIFFCTYDTVKSRLSPHASPGFQPLVHMGAACCGEVVSCLAKVPTEVVKQRSQAAAHPTTPFIILQTTLHSEGLRGMYRGFASTVLREIPFALLQFPLWEFLKSSWGHWQRTDLYVWQGALCGAVAGGISAAVTTPLDVAKTRIMLAERKQGATREDLTILTTLRNVYAQKGVQGPGFETSGPGPARLMCIAGCEFADPGLRHWYHNRFSF